MRRLLTFLGVALMALTASAAQWSNPSEDVPAYHATAPDAATKLPPVLTPAQLKAERFNLDWQSKVYVAAAKVPKVLYQLPCLCRCDQALGHTSLHSCFSGTHGAVCSTCAKEGYYAYLMTKEGKSVEQIRAGILNHEYESIDLNNLS